MRFVQYSLLEPTWPDSGQNIIAYQEDDHIVVYQAYKPEIADYTIKNQRLGGPGYNPARMSWIKPNFLWMMYRSGWANKTNQERILAFYIKKSIFEEIVSHGVLSHYDETIDQTKEIWEEKIKNSEVRIQWDPDHDPTGQRHPKRRAIQIGLKGKTLEKFCNEWITKIEDITEFVVKQRENRDPLIPHETILC